MTTEARFSTHRPTDSRKTPRFGDGTEKAAVTQVPKGTKAHDEGPTERDQLVILTARTKYQLSRIEYLEEQIEKYRATARKTVNSFRGMMLPIMEENKQLRSRAILESTFGRHPDPDPKEHDEVPHDGGSRDGHGGGPRPLDRAPQAQQDRLGAARAREDSRAASGSEDEDEGVSTEASPLIEDEDQRDPDRIYEIINRLRMIWLQNPQVPLVQLLVTLLQKTRDPGFLAKPFDTDDDIVQRALGLPVRLWKD